MTDKQKKILHDFKKLANLDNLIKKDLPKDKKLDEALLTQHLEKL